MNKSLFTLSALACAITPGLTYAQSDGDASLQPLEEIVVTGYSTTEEKKLLGAVNVVNLDDVQDLPSGNIMQNLQGRLPGVQISSNGNPNASSSVRIRGQGIGGLGFNDPLYVIDGVPTTKGMHELNPNDIASIQVLRDAATGSVYGARAANGVIVITTKKGSDAEGVQVKYNQSFQNYSYDLNPLNTQQRGRAVFQAAVNDGSNPNNASSLYAYDWNGDYDNPELSEIRLPEYLDSAQTMRPADTNWFDAVTRTAKVSDLHVSMGNSTDRSNVYASFGYYNAQGVVEESEFERLAFRVNSSLDFLDGDVTIGENFTLANQVSNKVNDLAENVLNLSIEQQSIVPVRTEDGLGWGGPAAGITDRDNPVRLVEMNKDNENTYNRVVGNAYVEYRPLDDLILRSNVGIDYGQFYYRDYTRAFQAGNLSFEDQLSTSHNWNKTLVWTNTAEQSWDFDGGHFLKVLAGAETVDFETEGFAGVNQGYASIDRDFAYLSQGTSGTEASGSGDAWNMQSYFTQIDYDFEGRYLASLTVRRDGSSRFGENNRYGTFPAVSAGWFVSDEAFFDGIDFINELKLRASWGENGNQEIDTRATSTIYESRYATPSTFTTEQDEGTAYDLSGADSGNLPSGFARVQIGNPDLKWETSVQTNVGIDFEMFDGTFWGSLDWFDKTTEDILTRTQPLATQGEGASRIVNGGTIENSGFELVLNYANDFEIERLGVFNYEISGNFSTADNEVIALPADVINSFPGDGRNKTILGQSINAVYGYVTDGLFQNQDEVDAHASQSGAAPGRIRYTDINGDGEITEADQDFFTTSDPDLIYGVNFKLGYENWDFNMFWQGVHGGEIRNHWRFFSDFTSLNAGSNYGDRVLGAWSPENADSNVPALTLVDNNEARSSTFFWEDASYLKLRDLSIGYTPSDTFWGAIGASTGRFYIQGQNLLTITPSGTLAQDPETPGGTFPIPRSINMGVNVTF